MDIAGAQHSSLKKRILRIVECAPSPEGAHSSDVVAVAYETKINQDSFGRLLTYSYLCAENLCEVAYARQNEQALCTRLIATLQANDTLEER